MSGQVTIVRSSLLTVDAATLWDRVTSSAGINDELRPYLTMRLPRHLGGSSITTAPLREPLGRAWILAGGVLPVEVDHLTLEAVDPPHRFHERSSMLTARVWEHQRELVAVGPDVTRLTDTVTVVSRRLVRQSLVRAVVTHLFTHRDRRLRLRFGQTGPDEDGRS